ncbi:MAG: peptidylprolyl isomerase [Prevotella sp.]|jgi:peptidyl-prolyl cis-trans isomerase SurA|nr:peptidylprolyl isomerase [Prevotella sp.]
MSKVSKIYGGLAALLLLGGITAQAGRSNGVRASQEGDTTKVQKEFSAPEGSVIDEVIWVVGDEPILKSDVESMRMQGLQEGMRWGDNPDCAIPEQIAVQKLFLHQAAIDSIEVTESQVASRVDQQLNFWINTAGSREKLEEYRGQTVSQIREELHDNIKNQMIIKEMRDKITEKVSVTPADVRRYFKNLPADSIPFVPTKVEVQILVRQPRIPLEEINRVKNQLREFTDRVNKGEASFSTLARLYSEDPGSARQGGEMGFVGRGILDPAFANVAFNLTDPKKISKIVESEFGYHIIQLIDKRGDKINCRHILLTPKVSDEAINESKLRLDSICMDIRDKKFSFETACEYLSEDKDTRGNHGLMAYSDEMRGIITSQFEMKDLPTEIAAVVDTMKVGEISAPFKMLNKRGKTVVAVAKLKSRVEGHRATITEDFQVMQDVVKEKQQAEVLKNWIDDKIKHTYVRMNDRYKDCKYQYSGWVK